MSAYRPNLPVMVGNEPPTPVFASADDDLSAPGVSLTQIMCILRATWKRSLLILFGLIFAFGVIIKILPKSYVATATLIVNRNDKDPLAGSVLPSNWANSYIPTQIQLIRSPVVLQPVITHLHLMRDPEFTRDFEGPPAAVREEVLSNLYNALYVSQGPGSDLLFISATSREPTEAAKIANTTAAVYLRLNRQEIDQPAVQRAKLYSQELAQLRAATIAAQNKVAAFRQQHGLVDLVPSKDDESEATLNDLEKKFLAAENRERVLEAALHARAWGPGSAGPGDRGGAGPAAQLAKEQTQLAKLRETLGPRHPEVLALESEIAATRRAITANLTAQLSAARKLVAQYSAAVDAQRNQVLKTRQMQDEGTKLLLELQSAEETYKRALDGYSQIEFASNGKFSDVALVSWAAPPVQATKPHKLKYFLASCVLSLGLAFGLPFAYELLFDRTLRCRDDLERNFGVPVLAQFGPISAREPR